MVHVDKAMRFISAPRVEVLLIPLDQVKNSYALCCMYRMANRPQQFDLIMARSIKMELTIFYWLHLQLLVRNTPHQGRRAALCRLRNMMRRSIRLSRGIGARLAHNRPVL